MLDRFNRTINYLRVSVTDRCNLRCTYCMPESGVKLLRHEDILSLEKIAEIVRVAVDMGISKVRLTGGEPLVRRNILHLVELLADINGIKDYAMSTNGIRLAEFAQGLKDSGLHRINISLDTLNPERFCQTTRGGELQCVLDGIDAAIAADLTPVKLNCVVEQSSTEPDAREVAKFAQDKNLDVRFIRRMDMATGRFWPIEGGDGGDCAHCNRLRLSSDGMIRPCLFSDAAFSVRQSGTTEAIRQALEAKPETGRKSGNTFYAIGG